MQSDSEELAVTAQHQKAGVRNRGLTIVCS